DEALTRLRVQGERFAVFVLDLDRFKAVNDTLGHPIGDTLLTRVAQRLQNATRGIGTVARLGGDEFAILATVAGDPVPRYVALAERLRAAVADPYDIEGHHVITGTSIGIALAPDHGAEVDELLRNADLALYRAKTEARTGYCFFQPEMYDEARVL